MSDPRFSMQVNYRQPKPSLYFPSNLGNNLGAQQHYMIIDAYKNSLATGYQGDSHPDATVALYIPPGALKTAYSSKYETFEGFQGVQNGVRNQIIKNQAQNALSGYGGGGESTVADTLSVMKDAVTSPDNYSKAFNASAAGASYLAAKAIKEKSDIGKAAMIGAGTAVNPYMSVFFAGPGDFRTHTFSYDFIPQTKEESVMVQKIIQAFKFRMLPGKMQNADHSYFLSFPHQFRINFYAAGQQQSQLFQIDRAVLTNMSVDYGGQGTPVFFDGPEGYPYNTKLDLTFQDTRLITREDTINQSGHGV